MKGEGGGGGGGGGGGVILSFQYILPGQQGEFFQFWGRSGGGVVDNTQDYQFRDRKIDPPLLWSFG